jgi:Ca-activated chloride channel family protein
MIFHWSHVLWLLAIPALWLALDLLRNQKITTAAAPSKIIHAEATRSSLVIGHWSFQRGLKKPRWRFCLGLAFALVALARPQWGRLEEPIFDQSREILLALDLSKSMNAPDVKPSRLDRAKLLSRACSTASKANAWASSFFPAPLFSRVRSAPITKFSENFCPR